MGIIGRSALLALAACGGTTQAVTSDAPTEAPPIDAIAPGPATIAITEAGAPVAGVEVWFQRADGKLITETMTDATGIASAVVASGAIVTVLDPFSQTGAADLRSYLGVQPGDRLTLDQPALDTVAMTVVAPVDPNAGTYLVFSPCGESELAAASATGPVSFVGCHGATDLMIETLFPDSENPIATLYVPNVTLTDGGVIDLTGMSYTSLQAQTFTYTYPNQSFFISAACDELAGAHGIVFADCASSRFPTVTGTEFEFLVPTADATFVVDTQGTGFPGGPDGQIISREDILDWGPFSPGYLLDTGAAALPEFVAPPAFDIIARRITWSETVAGSVPDLTVALLAGSEGTWEIAAPYRSGALELPVLPVDAPFLTLSVAMMLLAEVPGGYDAARPSVLSTLYLSGQHADVSHFITGASGHAAVTQWTVE